MVVGIAIGNTMKSAISTSEMHSWSRDARRKLNSSNDTLGSGSQSYSSRFFEVRSAHELCNHVNRLIYSVDAKAKPVKTELQASTPTDSTRASSTANHFASRLFGTVKFCRTSIYNQETEASIQVCDSDLRGISESSSFDLGKLQSFKVYCSTMYV